MVELTVPEAICYLGFFSALSLLVERVVKDLAEMKVEIKRLDTDSTKHNESIRAMKTKFNLTEAEPTGSSTIIAGEKSDDK